MKCFCNRLIIFIIIGFLLNIVGGLYLKASDKILAKRKLFYPPVRMEEFYNQQDNIDIAFLGSSRCYQGFDPEIVDSLTGMNSFNLGSSSQTPTTSYFLLEELFRLHKPKYIIYDLSVEIMNTKQFVNGGFILDAMENSQVRWDFFLNGFDFQEKIQLFLPVYRYRRNKRSLFHSLQDGIDEHFKKKRRYKAKGFVINDRDINKEKIYNFEITEQTKMHINYLDKINELVMENNCELIFVTFSYPSTTTIVNEDKFVEYMKEKVVEGYDREYLNYLEREATLSDDYFADANHFNYQGAELVSEEIGKLIIEIENETACQR